MSSRLRKVIPGFLIFIGLGFVSILSANAQSCLTADEVRTIVNQINSAPAATLNRQLSNELLKLAESQRILQEDLARDPKGDKHKRIVNVREKAATRLCQIMKEFGWPRQSLVGRDGAVAAFYLFRSDAPFDLQIALLPAILAALKKGEISKPDFAGLIDRLRLESGAKQLFGTQASVKNGFIILLPIEAEAQVDARRRQYLLPPLVDQIRALEEEYGLPLMRAPAALAGSFKDSLKSTVEKDTAASVLGVSGSASDDIVRIDTNLVSMNVSVYNNKLKTYVGTLAKNDFQVFEDGQEQNVTFFATTDVPFDLVLLLDLSGSTSRKRKLIRQTTKGFIEAARPGDRIAIVTFSDTTNVVAPLTEDRSALLAAAEKIDGDGGTKLWDALKFTLDHVLGERTPTRRRAIVMMSDGADNALAYWTEAGSQITFADLLEAVRKDDALVIPIYLDTEADESGDHRVYQNARKTLAELADESGGLYYKARKIEDLKGVYGQVLDDLGKVYSLGYKPINGKRDGSWRVLKVQVVNHPELVARVKPGYYSN